MTIELNRLARLARRLVGSPTAVLCLFGDDLDESETGTAGADDRRADHFAREVAAAGRAAVSADRIGVPLLSESGRTLGSLVAIGPRFPFYDENDMMALADLAVSAVREVELREKTALVQVLIGASADDDEGFRDFDTAVGTPFPERSDLE
jgi:hypothetical protein